jgi:hypothetical protein
MSKAKPLRDLCAASFDHQRVGTRKQSTSSMPLLAGRGMRHHPGADLVRAIADAA